MSLAKLLPSRKKARDVEVLYDIDAILSKRVGVTLFGETHILEPVTVEVFYRFVEEFSKLRDMEAKASLEEVDERLTEIYRSVCKTITHKIVAKMEMQQKLSLFAIIVDLVQGKQTSVDPKDLLQKKN